MELRKYRWSRVYESSEEELLPWLASKNIKAERWTAAEDETIEPHAHSEDTHLFCAEGLIKVEAGGKIFSLQPGDALDIPANTTYSAHVGFGGCACYESPTQKEKTS
jgi:quercetin dioxygenase-like cupin family protein